MIETSRIPYKISERSYGTYRFDYYFMDIMVWLIGFPLLCLLLLTPLFGLLEWWNGEQNLLVNRILGLTGVCVGIAVGVRMIVGIRAEDILLWQKQKTQHEQDVAEASAERFLIRNIIQYWSITVPEALGGYLIRTQENEWLYLISELLDDFEEDEFPRNEVTIIRAPATKEVLEIKTDGSEVEFVGFVEHDLFLDDCEDLSYEILDAEVGHRLESSLLA